MDVRGTKSRICLNDLNRQNKRELLNMSSNFHVLSFKNVSNHSKDTTVYGLRLRIKGDLDIRFPK